MKLFKEMTSAPYIYQSNYINKEEIVFTSPNINNFFI